MIIAWVILSIIIGALGKDRKCGFFYAMIASLLFSPVIGAIYVALSDRKSDIKMKEDISATSKILKLKELSDLRDKGAITGEEYEKLKREIIPNENYLPDIDPLKKFR
jgi:hypothetical protein